MPNTTAPFWRAISSVVGGAVINDDGRYAHVINWDGIRTDVANNERLVVAGKTATIFSRGH
jgi:hypothetical protein